MDSHWSTQLGLSEPLTKLEQIVPSSFVIDIRPATVSDAAGIATVKVDAWRDAYVGLLPNESLIAMNADKLAPRMMRILLQLSDPNQFCVADYGGQVIGFCHGGGQRRALNPLRRRQPGFAEIFTLYVDPSFQGLGIGTALLFRVAAQLREAGYFSLALSMLSGNRIARRFYEHLGGVEGEEAPSVVMGVSTSEVLYRWEDIEHLLDRLESAMG